MKKNVKHPEVIIRICPKKYLEKVWQWRNDPLTRKMSRNNERISWQDHLDWFLKVQKNPRHYCFLGFIEKEPIGIVRFDYFDEGTFEIGVNLAPIHRKKGLSYPLVEKAIEHLCSCTEVKMILAEVKNINIASNKLFQKLQFTRINHDSVMSYYRLELSLC